jgi:fido (protein-threonine AMPylation protein)
MELRVQRAELLKRCQESNGCLDTDSPIVVNKKSDSFGTDFFLKLHKEMFGDVWDWAGKIRTAEGAGAKSYL